MLIYDFDFDLDGFLEAMEERQRAARLRAERRRARSAQGGSVVEAPDERDEADEPHVGAELHRLH